MKAVIIVGIVLLFAALVICLAPLKTVAYAVMVEYKDTETYYEDEPYQVTETYTENVPLTFEANSYIDEDVTYEHHQVIIGDIVFQDEIVEVPIYIACVDVKNTDDVFGQFAVYFSGFEPIYIVGSTTRILDLEPGEEKTAECAGDYIDDWEYEVVSGTKEVEKERTVTKYRQVEKQRTVIKHRPETRYEKVTFLYYLLNY